jgi:uncharacterized protein (TIGR00251 family)
VYCRHTEEGILLFCHLQPAASRDEFAGLYGDRIKIRLKSAAVDGKANQHLLQFLASHFGVASKNITLQKGETSRQKTVLIKNATAIPEACLISCQG